MSNLCYVDAAGHVRAYDSENIYHPEVLSHRIVSNIKLVDENSCWIWNGPLHNKKAYVSVKDRKCYAIRVSYALRHDRDIDSLMVIYKLCDTESCVNPDHMIEGGQEMQHLFSKDKKSRHRGNT